ncbi:MAG: amidohydrolase [Hellea sp.]|nr:amidohydrolase [Hellea sp.]
MTRLTEIKIILLGLTALAAVACSPQKPENIGYSDSTVFHGGTILSLTPDNSEAMMIHKREIFALGFLDHFQKIAPEATYVDLGGKTVMPGFIDSHVHVRELGMDAIKADLVGVSSVHEMVQRLRDYYPDPKAGQWLIGQGWDEGQFASRGYPDRGVLDEAFPQNPIKLESLHGFAGFYNGAALDIAGVTSATVNPNGGTILRREDGEATGVMLALGQGLVNQHAPDPDQAQIEKAILAGLNIMAEKGVTSIHEAGMTPKDVQAFQALAKRGELPIRVYGMLNGNDQELMTEWFSRGMLDDPDDYLDIRAIKVFYDGSLGSRTALMKAPYTDSPETQVAAERISQDDMLALGRAAADHEFQMAVHAIGDLGNDVTLGQYEDILESPPGYDHRWRIEHAQVVLPDFFKRQAALGVIASMQPSHAVGDSKWAEDRVGPVRIRNAYAWRTILSHGGHLIFNSDLPGEPWTPMETLHFAVNRQSLKGTPEGGWYTDQALNVIEAIRAMTIGGAHSAFQDDKLGTLEADKWADFVILSDNPLSVPKDQIKNIKVEQVWVAGQRYDP